MGTPVHRLLVIISMVPEKHLLQCYIILSCLRHTHQLPAKNKDNTKGMHHYHASLMWILDHQQAGWPLQWRHSECDGVSSYRPHDCLLNSLFSRRSKKTSNPRVPGLCAGDSPVTGEFPAQRSSNAENVSIWWRNHACVNQNGRRYRVKLFRYFEIQELQIQ